MSPTRVLPRPLLAAALSVLVLLAGCAGGTASGPGGATGTATISSTVAFETDCGDTGGASDDGGPATEQTGDDGGPATEQTHDAGDDTCAVTATLESTDGATDVAVHVRDHHTHEPLHTFDDPATQVGHNVILSLADGTVLEVVLEREAGSEVTQRYTVGADRS